MVFRKAIVYTAFLARTTSFLAGPGPAATAARIPAQVPTHSRRFAVSAQASVVLEKGSDVIAREPAVHPAFELTKVEMVINPQTRAISLLLCASTRRALLPT